ncbi:fimbria/pilus periplasmic chaperone [Sphingobium sp. JS3065]|jgi:fimbrial chaperone protein|uniref:fimbrial biogenesis chaperone n=1 Tax=Sphingobium sp. JS3065 TaxID=2970925 RepID=UPI002264F049|nr:fimbria/pilus periplasmic chaperone [Sphingobium sp. JS3065]UZW53837.1 fimbria/pilus periplasmic chaperone [Sphingobium sp. JS3065]
MTEKWHGARSIGILAGGLCALLSAMGMRAEAATLRVLPVRVELAAGKQFCALTIANDDAASTTLQIRGYGWRKDGEGNDRLDPDAGLVVNPSIVSIPAGETRLVRCSLPAGGGAREESYRLVIDELPTGPVAPGMLRTLLRVSIPLFRAPANAAPMLNWAVVKGADGQPRIALANQGDRHVQVAAVILHPAGSGKAVKLERGFYLLAGGRIELPLASQAAIARVEVQTTRGTLPASRAVGER